VRDIDMGPGFGETGCLHAVNSVQQIIFDVRAKADFGGR
jgi:hypothetical protein